ncbi:MAG TPA: folylpolyglutamate synthase/dihydrofolate synthase family protein [Bryobacteraceae bacterium]|nr:folylpolyglutamate synthase/dihydrofolate synthase family protein [Bryobacteraceae bacterium]
MSYPDSVRYLYSLGNELKTGTKWGLGRMKTLLAALGNPEGEQRLVHVAGTNGKGSTCAMIASILRHAGFTTGLYTSPHLIEPTERIQIDGVPVTHEAFVRAFEVVHSCAEKLLREHRVDAHPSYFETVTAMAFVIFRDRCDIGVIEVGLGGRLDATNVIAPEVCVITPVAYDHESFLGNTLESIAAEKAGIMKAGVPLVLSRQLPAADTVVSERARELGSRIVRSDDARVSHVISDPYGSSFLLDEVSYECALPGKHQIENATASILACRELDIPPEAIQVGLRAARWPGRLEFISHRPDFVLDGAHNPAAAAALAEYIREFWAERPVWLVYGAMRDKAIDEVTAQLFPLAERLIVTAPNFPRALRPEAILELAPHPNARLTHTIAEALDIARAAPQNAVVFFTGSLFVVGEARALLLGKAYPVS